MTEGFPAIYASNKTWVTVDLVETSIIFIFVVLAVTYLLIIPGYTKTKSIYTIVKAILSILIGGIIMVGNYGQEWETGRIESMTPYRAGESSKIFAQIGVKIGLRSVNITLQGRGEKGSVLEREVINYNERFLWTWDQGRIGFGPNAGLLQRSLREAQRRGLPVPITWIVDYLVIDGEGLRYGRFYRTAGWYCHIVIWTAFPVWILANIFLQSVARYAAYCTGLVGALMVLSCIIWMFVRNPGPLVILFESGAITTSYGSTFWLTLSGGLLCFVLASVLIILDLRCPNSLSAFLGIDILDQYDEYFIREVELDDTREKHNNCESMEMGKMSEQLSKDHSDVMLLQLKRRSTAERVQKYLLRVSPMPIKIENMYDDTAHAVYANHDSLTVPGPSIQRIENFISKPPLPRRKRK
ncbi:dual oxidase maturation factor 1-like isoform X2 [Microplitis mediator]|uniref:dual oxidase maturation factor 1-like isoform X2 n=1 Tax=Microplitis mediator TaxID=375433 RepID=UPI002557B42A|nr:dual oxidase maturation factor 1-like isoform X2 [Microplitis mediator]